MRNKIKDVDIKDQYFSIILPINLFLMQIISK